MGAAKSKEPIVIPDPKVAGVQAALCALYKAKILPLEKHLDYEFYDGPYLYDAEFASKPSVMFVGQYSVGKTTVIRYLVGEDIPGARIGPEPTTDTFSFVSYDTNKRLIPGTSLMADEKFGFKGLAKFGATFLSKCNEATCPSPILQHISFIDTPGILSGEKQLVNRGYDFEQVVSFLAEKVDRILLLFDAHKLDISDEFKRTILALQGNEEKIKIILNKVDSVEPGSLNRVNGALMWSLGKVLKCPEVPRLFTGSFWDRPIRYPQYRELFENDTKALFDDLKSLPRSVNVRRINDVVKRARQIKTFVYLMHEMVKARGCCCQEAGKRHVIETLDTVVYAKVCLNHRIPREDLPLATDLKKKLQMSDHKKWRSLNPETTKMLALLDEFINVDVTRLIAALPADSQIGLTDQGPLGAESDIFNGVQDYEMMWITVAEEGRKNNWEHDFQNLKPVDRKLQAINAKAHMEKSGLPSALLAQIWRLVDLDKDNKISVDEFFLMNYLIDRQLAGKPLPRQLPKTLMPPSSPNVSEVKSSIAPEVKSSVVPIEVKTSSPKSQRSAKHPVS